MEQENIRKYKKTNKIIIILCVVLLVVGAIIYFKDSFRSDILNNSILNEDILNSEKIVQNEDYLYEKGVEFIKEKYHDLNTRREQEDYQILVSYKKFGITKDNTNSYAYMWVLSESYFVKENTLYNGRSNSSLYKIIFQNDEVVGYEMPDDGKDYENTESFFMSKEYEFANELKKICPNTEVYNSIMEYEIDLSNEEQIQEHYSYLEDLTINRQVLSQPSNNSNNNNNRNNNRNNNSNDNLRRRRRR